MQGIWDGGGVANYIRRVSNAQRLAGHKLHYLDTLPFTGAGDEIARPTVVRDDNDLFIQAKALELDILHLHMSVSVLPPGCTPVIRTIHGNHPYCPSGSRHLKRWGQPCDRSYSLSGCLWGHFVDHCGSIRPQHFYPGFQSTWQEMHKLGEVSVIASSQFVKDQMVRSGYRSDSIRVLHHPAPSVGEYLPPEQGDVPHFVFLGRITPEKGLIWLLRALAEVKVPFYLDIAGSGNQEKTIHQLAEHLGLMKKITFHGWVKEEQAIQLIQKARALVFPSVWHEPAGLISLEAAAAGRAIIASQVGGIPEYASRLQNALLVAPNDVHRLARSIEQLATDWPLAKLMGAEGRKMAKKHFLLEEHMQELMKLYELAIESKST